jgi:hypothetical protein
MNRFFQSHRYQLLVLAAIFILFSVFIIKPWQLFFLNDDFMHIPDARLVLRSGFMRPVPNVFLWLDKILYGTQPLGFFITSILLHGLAVFSVYYLVEIIQRKLKLLQSYSELPFWVSLLFLLYPFHAESIMWTIARVSIMATAFTLFSLACFIKSNDLKKDFWYAWIWLLLALFSYESMWNVLLLYFLVAWYKSRNVLIKKNIAILQAAIMCATFAAYFAIRFLLLNSLVGNGYEDMEDNLKNLKLVSGNLVKLTARIFTPAADDSRIFVGLFLILSAGFIFLIYKQFKANRNTGMLLIILWGAMITGVITAAPLGIDTHFHESDRYTYYASFFFCLFLAIVFLSIPVLKIRQIAAVLICVLFITGFYFLQRDYAFSSSVTRGTIDFVKNLPAGKQLVFLDVPARHRGALIFRTSLPDAIEWLGPTDKPDSVIVYSLTTGFQKTGDFKTGVISIGDLKTEKNESFTNDLSQFVQQQEKTGKSPIVLWYGKGGLWQVTF